MEFSINLFHVSQIHKPISFLLTQDSGQHKVWSRGEERDERGQAATIWQ